MYEPFGEPKAAGKLLLNRHKEELLHVPFGFTGEAHDFYSGLIYLRARYYDPGAGSFISRDSYLGDLLRPLSQNRYTYAENNPINYIDPSGHETVFGGNAREYIQNLLDNSPKINIEVNNNKEKCQGAFGEGTSNGCITITSKLEPDDVFPEVSITLTPEEIEHLNDPAFFLIFNHAEEHAGIFPEGFDKLTPQEQVLALKTYQKWFEDTGKAKEIYIQAVITIVFTGLDLYFSRGATKGAGKVNIPDKARDIANQVKSKNGAPPQGYKGGKTFNNQPVNGGQKLPDGVNYKEYDVNPYVKGQNRGTERIVTGDDGSVWYTNDHYHTFTKIE